MHNRIKKQIEELTLPLPVDCQVKVGDTFYEQTIHSFGRAVHSFKKVEKITKTGYKLEGGNIINAIGNVRGNRGFNSTNYVYRYLPHENFEKVRPLVQENNRIYRSFKWMTDHIKLVTETKIEGNLKEEIDPEFFTEVNKLIKQYYPEKYTKTDKKS